MFKPLSKLALGAALAFSVNAAMAEEATPAVTPEKPQVEAAAKKCPHCDPQKMAERQAAREKRQAAIKEKMKERVAKIKAERTEKTVTAVAATEKMLADVQGKTDEEILSAFTAHLANTLNADTKFAREIYQAVQSKLTTMEIDAAKKAKLLEALNGQYIAWLEGKSPQMVRASYFDKLTDENLTPEARQAIMQEMREKMSKMGMMSPMQRGEKGEKGGARGEGKFGKGERGEHKSGEGRGEWKKGDGQRPPMMQRGEKGGAHKSGEGRGEWKKGEGQRPPMMQRGVAGKCEKGGDCQATE